MGGNTVGQVVNTMANGSFGSVSQGKSLHSSIGNDPVTGSIEASAVFKSPSGSETQIKGI